MKIFDIETNSMVDAPKEYEKNCVFTNGICTEYRDDNCDVNFNNNTIESVIKTVYVSIKTTYVLKNDHTTLSTEEEYFYDNNKLVKHVTTYAGSTSLDVEKFQYFENGNLQMYTHTDRYGNNVEKTYYDTKYDVCLMPTLNGEDMYHCRLKKNINSTDIKFVKVSDETNLRSVYEYRCNNGVEFEEEFEINSAGYLTYRTLCEGSDDGNKRYIQAYEYDENNKLVQINSNKCIDENEHASTHYIIYE